MQQIDLTDSTADRYLLDAPGLSLLAFHSRPCAPCKIAREQLPPLDLPGERLCWIDAGHHGGLVARYEVSHLPALFPVRDGAFSGPCNPPRAEWDLTTQNGRALDTTPA